jgi:hypothetical protein
MKAALAPAARPDGDAGRAAEAKPSASGPRPGELVPVARTNPPAPSAPAPGPQAADPSRSGPAPAAKEIGNAAGTAPDIRLSAIAWDADPARRIVIMNDKILHEGESLGQTKVARIEADHVELVRDGESVVKRLKDESGR